MRCMASRADGMEGVAIDNDHNSASSCAQVGLLEKKGFCVLLEKRPRLDPWKTKTSWTLVDSAEELSSACRRMLKSIRACRKDEKKMKAGLKKCTSSAEAECLRALVGLVRIAPTPQRGASMRDKSAVDCDLLSVSSCEIMDETLLEGVDFSGLASDASSSGMEAIDFDFSADSSSSLGASFRCRPRDASFEGCL